MIGKGKSSNAALKKIWRQGSLNWAIIVQSQSSSRRDCDLNDGVSAICLVVSHSGEILSTALLVILFNTNSKPLFEINTTRSLYPTRLFNDDEALVDSLNSNGQAANDFSETQLEIDNIFNDRMHAFVSRSFINSKIGISFGKIFYNSYFFRLLVIDDILLLI